MTEQPDYLYFECPDCEFSVIHEAAFGTEVFCQLCADDSGHKVLMNGRVATSADNAEGDDARPFNMRP